MKIFFAAWAVLLGVLLWASSGFAVVWDEVIYFHFSDVLRSWASNGFPFDAASLSQYWDHSPYYNPHPPLFKIVSAASSAFLDGLLPFPLNYRLPHLFFISLGLALVGAVLARRFGIPAAVAAVAAAAFQPRIYGEFLVAGAEGPAILAWLALPVLLWTWEGEEDAKRRRLWAAAYVFIQVCGAGAKVTGLLAAFPLACACIFFRRWRSLALVSAAGAVAWAGAAVWSPAQWSDPLHAAFHYLFYPLTRSEVPIATYYLGRVYDGLIMPWHYFSVVTAVVTPVVLLAALPAALAVRGEARKLLAALAAPIFFWLILVHLPGTPRHDGVRQFASVYPLLGLVAWAGWEAILARVSIARTLSPPLLRSLRFFPAACLCLSLWRAHPYELSFYNVLVGGLRGAEKKGFEVSYWLEPARATLDWINASAGPKSQVAIIPEWPHLLRRYQKEGLLRPDLEVLFQDEVTEGYLLVCRRRSNINDFYYHALPASREVKVEGVSLAKVVAWKKGKK